VRVHVCVCACACACACVVVVVTVVVEVAMMVVVMVVVTFIVGVLRLHSMRARIHFMLDDSPHMSGVAHLRYQRCWRWPNRRVHDVLVLFNRANI
jgi:hypothetical protein